MMGRRASVSGASPPDRAQLRLLPNCCDHCVASALCGQKYTTASCLHNTSAPVDSLEPDRDRRPLIDFHLPETPRTWGLPIRSPKALPVVDTANPDINVYGTTLKISRGRHQIHPGACAIAFLIGRDNVIERLWSDRFALGLHLKERGYVAAVAPAYSNWDHLTPYHALTAISRSATFADELARHLPTVPTIQWRTPPDIERQLDWLLEGTLNMMAVDIGTADFELIIDGLAQLADMLAHRAVALPELLAYGVWSRERIMRVARVWNANIVIASQRPSILANQGHAVTEGATETFAPDITRDALKPINLASFAIHVDEAINTARAVDSAQLEGFATASRGVA